MKLLVFALGLAGCALHEVELAGGSAEALLLDGVTAERAARFASARDGDAPDLEVIAPSDGAVLPQNLGALGIRWTRKAGMKAGPEGMSPCELTLRSGRSEQRVYLARDEYVASGGALQALARADAPIDIVLRCAEDPAITRTTRRALRVTPGPALAAGALFTWSTDGARRSRLPGLDSDAPTAVKEPYALAVGDACASAQAITAPNTLETLADGTSRKLDELPEDVALALTRDGQTLAIGRANELRLVDVASGSELARSTLAMDDGVVSLAFTTDALYASVAGGMKDKPGARILRFSPELGGAPEVVYQGAPDALVLLAGTAGDELLFAAGKGKRDDFKEGALLHLAGALAATPLLTPLDKASCRDPAFVLDERGGRYLVFASTRAAAGPADASQLYLTQCTPDGACDSAPLWLPLEGAPQRVWSCE